MPNIIDRNALSGLIPEPVTREIMQGAIAESAVLRMGKRLANMSSKTQTINVLDALPRKSRLSSPSPKQHWMTQIMTSGAR